MSDHHHRNTRNRRSRRDRRVRDVARRQQRRLVRALKGDSHHRVPMNGWYAGLRRLRSGLDR